MLDVWTVVACGSQGSRKRLQLTAGECCPESAIRQARAEFARLVLEMISQSWHHCNGMHSLCIFGKDH
jgi:hypothetical protein